MQILILLSTWVKLKATYRFYLKPKLYILLLATILLFSCQNMSTTCIVTFEGVKQPNLQTILIDTSGSEDEIEDRSFAKTGIGGSYSFYKNELIKSYCFITK